MTSESNAAVGALMPCPWCGGNAVRLYGDGNMGFKMLHTCADDCMTTVEMVGNTMAEVAERWNRRAALSAPATTGEGEVERVARAIHAAEAAQMPEWWVSGLTWEDYKPEARAAIAAMNIAALPLSIAPAITGAPGCGGEGCGCADTYREAMALAKSLWAQHYRETAPDWQPLSDLRGILSQIDNMTTGLTRRKPGWEAGAEAPKHGRRFLAWVPSEKEDVQGCRYQPAGYGDPFPWKTDLGNRMSGFGIKAWMPLPPPPSREG